MGHSAITVVPEEPTQISERKPVLVFAIVAIASIIYLLGIVHYAQVRPIDGDEGYYVTAARLVAEGKIPYRDFAYPQGPLVPYLYSWIWVAHAHSLLAMRLLSAAFGGLSVSLWGVCLLRLKRLPTAVSLGTFLVVLLNPYWFSWNVVVKTFAASNLLMSIATVCLYVALHSERVRWCVVAGLALGACASARTLYGPLVPAVFLWLLFMEWREAKSTFRKTLAFLVGATAGLMPMIVSLVIDPKAFVFNNLLYHRFLGDSSRQSFLDYGNLRHIIHGYLFLAFTLVTALYLTAELVLAFIGLVSVRMLQKRQEHQAGPYNKRDYLFFELALLMFIVYVVTALVPFPPFDQYFDGPLVPFLVPFITEGLRLIVLSGRKWLTLLLAGLAPVLFLYDAKRPAKEYAGAPESQLSSFRSVSRVIESHGLPTDVVLSCWPGYVFESGRQYFPGSEDQFNFYVTGNLTAAERERYHIVSVDQALQALSNRRVNLVITSPWIMKNHFSVAQQQAFWAVVNTNYLHVGQVDTIGIYQRRSATTETNGMGPAAEPRVQW